jgi:hypothetical protein
MRMNSRRAMVIIAAVALTGLVLHAAANEVPLNLSRPDGKPGDVKKKVKVYLLAGQSNMNGMGDLTGARPPWTSIFLSADPAIIPGIMPIGGSAIARHGVFDAKATVYSGKQPVKTVPLHAVKRAGPVSGNRLLVVGGGPIGLLLAMTARAFGAAPVALSDIVEARRKMALELGADVALDPVAKNLMEQVKQLTGDGFEVIFEASGARPALRQAFDLVRPGGTIVQIGTLGTEDVPLPENQLMVRAIQFIGSFRYGNVFDEAIRLVASGRLNLQPLISRVFPLAEASQAFFLASDKAQALKVQIQIGNN